MSTFDQLEAVVWGSTKARDEIRLLRQEVEELKGLLWMAADTQISRQLVISDESKMMFNKERCYFQSWEDAKNLCTVIEAKDRTRT